MFEKVRAKFAVKSVVATLTKMKDELELRLNLMNTANYTKFDYITDSQKTKICAEEGFDLCRKVISVINQTKQAFVTKEAYQTYLDKINDAAVTYCEVLNRCKYGLQKKQEQFEPDKITVKYRQKIRLDGRIVEVPEKEVEKTPKAKEYTEMDLAVERTVGKFENVKYQCGNENVDFLYIDRPEFDI